MFTGINLLETKKQVYDIDPDQKNPTVFHLGSLNSFVKAFIEDISETIIPNPENPEGDSNLKINFAYRNLLTVKFGLRKIENFKDPQQPAPVTVEAEEVMILGRKCLAIPDSVLDILVSGSLINKICRDINEMSKLSEAETKN